MSSLADIVTKNAITIEDLPQRNRNIPFKRYVEIELKRLADSGTIPAVIKKHCERHFLDYESKPFTLLLNKAIYTNCPRCEAEIIREREGYYNEEEEQKKQTEAQRVMKEMLIARGVSEKFFNNEVDYSKGLFMKHSHLLQEVLKNNYIIFGGVGSGKSTFVYELCKSYYKMNKIAEVVNANILLSHFKSNYSNLEFLQKFYARTDCLCIDEIDNIKPQDYIVIDDIISFFYDKCSKLVFIGNTTPDKFKEALSQKSISRLHGNTFSINAGNIDLRKEV